MSAIHYTKTALLVRPGLTKMGKILICVLLITIFEGAFRKWVSASLTTPLVLARDALALYGTIWVIGTGRFRLTSFMGQALVIWSILLVVWGILQTIAHQNNPLILVVGLRFWLLYLWFACAIGASISQYDLKSVQKVLIYSLLVMAPLAVVQHLLPPGAFINKQLDGDETEIFLVGRDIVRTTGTFSFTAGYTVFLAFISPWIFSLLDRKRDERKIGLFAQIIVFVLGTATLVSGSRGSIIFFTLLFACYIVISVICGSGRRKTSVLMTLILSGGMIVLASFIFSRAFDATESRFKSAAESEKLDDRIVAVIFGEPGLYDKFSFLGNGIGAGNNFSASLGADGRRFSSGETESARTILEGGILGLIFTNLKIIVMAFGMLTAWKIAKSSGNSLPLMLWLTAGVALVTWAIIGQLTINSFGYLILGLAMASLRLFSKRGQ